MAFVAAIVSRRSASSPNTVEMATRIAVGISTSGLYQLVITRFLRGTLLILLLPPVQLLAGFQPSSSAAPALASCFARILPRSSCIRNRPECRGLIGGRVRREEIEPGDMLNGFNS